jgi:RNA polymerase sigma factor (sigma-70 family)
MTTGQLGAVVGHLRTLAGAGDSELSDAQLLDRFRRQMDQSAFAALVRRHGRLVWGVCCNVLHHQHDAEDAFQATFLVLVRRAASVCKPEALGSWLHGVAYRVAMKAKRAAGRRRRHEQEKYPASHTAGAQVSESAWRQLQAVLEEEVQALPDRLRVPFVACYLEGGSRNEVARQFGCKLTTVSSWLTRARARLLHRLARRGVSLSAALAAVVLPREVGSAGVPAPLLQSAVRAALAYAEGETLSASIGRLAEGGSQAMYFGKIKIAALILLAAGVVTTACGMLGLRESSDEAKAVDPKPKVQPVNAKLLAGKDDKEIVTYSGRVLGPDGKSFASATLSVWIREAKTERCRSRETTDKDGRFRIMLPRGQLEQALVVAAAEGYGPDWVELRDSTPKDHELALRLARDDLPINGRIVNLEGRGIAGVTVNVRKLEKREDDGDLAAFIATKQKWARGNFVNGPALKTLPARALPMPASVTADADGHFRLTGFGRERVLHLTIEGQSIATAYVEALTRAGPVEGTTTGNENEITYGATFERVSAPSKPIIGTVREKGTGKSLAGITIYCRRCSATTDVKGQYRIDGLLKQDAYTISAHGTPYFSAARNNVPDTLGFDPITVDFELERGLAISGRVFDKVTGKPVVASVVYHAFADNPHLKRVSSLNQDGGSGDDGSFKITGLPGPGMLWVLAHEDDFVKLDADPTWKLVPGINTAPPVAHGCIRIDPKEDDPKSATFEIALEPAKFVKASVVGPDDKPATGYFVAGLTATPRNTSAWLMPRDSPTFTVRGLSARRPRTVVVYSAEKKLGKAQVVRGDEMGPIAFRLEPLSSLMGRVLDNEGRPWAGVHVQATLEGKGDAGATLPVQFFLTSATWAEKLEAKATTDGEGKFRLDGLLPSLKYTLLVSEDGSTDPERVIARRAGFSPPAAGWKKDLGDLQRQKAR